MEIRYAIQSAEGVPIHGVVNNTIYRLGDGP
jgi:hypothetical protein